jgi:aminoglycoside phosphotransferase
MGVSFEDGVGRIARIKRQNAAIPSPSICEYSIRSEAATYRFLEKTNVPAPKVHEVVTHSANPVHIPYILMDLVPGRPVNSCVDATPEQLRKVMGQLATVYQEFTRHPFDEIGSLGRS